MNTTYFPILKALAAEFSALENAKSKHADRLVPVFEIPKVPDTKKYNQSSTPKAEFIHDVCQGIGGIWEGKAAMFDIYQWDPAEVIESGEHVASHVYNSLKSVGVEIIPVVGYDRWSVQDYQLALKSVSRGHAGIFCIRLDHIAFEDSAEPDFFQENLEDILNVLELSPKNCHLILDFEDVTPIAVIDLLSKFETLFALVTSYGFMSYSIAGCSLPKAINEAVKKPNTCGTVLRKEMLLWKGAREIFPKMPIFFGDYGVRGPNSNQGVPSPHTNGKIRYTIDQEYFIARGQSNQLPPKGEQMWRLAQIIVNSVHYLGPQFSWGDKEIMRCSNKEFKGNAGQWIAIDTSHHLAHVVVEVAEFERNIIAQIERVEL